MFFSLVVRFEIFSVLLVFDVCLYWIVLIGEVVGLEGMRNMVFCLLLLVLWKILIGWLSMIL